MSARTWPLSLAAAALLSTGADAARTPPTVVEVLSPGGRVAITLELKEYEGRKATAVYRVSRDGAPLIHDSGLGLYFKKDVPLDSRLVIADVARRTAEETGAFGFGKTSSARVRYSEAAVTLEETAPPQRRFTVVLRAFDDGVAFRYMIPRQPPLDIVDLREELTQFDFAGNPTAYYLPLEFGSSYETFYASASSRDVRLARDVQIGLPLLLEFPKGIYGLLTEANLTNYAGLYLVPSRWPNGPFESRLAPSLAGGDAKVRAAAPFETPWRVLLIGSAAAILESNVVRALNPPSRIGDASWIKPGKSVFGWWNGYYMPDSPPFVAGVNTPTIKRFIDFAAASGIAYATIDGTNDEAWYGGPVGEYAGQDVTRANPKLDLPEVLAYAKTKGVAIRLWTHWKGLENRLEDVFRTYARWGVSGVMVDFINGDSQERVAFVDEATEAAARHRLTINFHGMYKPTGRERTWPNVISYEGVLGTEYNKWDAVGSTPEHELLALFARMPAGPLDVHQGSVRPVVPEKYAPDNRPVTMGTLVRQLAAYVVYENPHPLVADSASAYERYPDLLAFIRDVPVAWDETKVLAAEVPHYLVIARRKGKDWYVGAVTDRTPRALEIPLRLLGPGSFQAELFVDGADAGEHPESYQHETLVMSADVLLIPLARAGGYAAKLSPR
ncbi:MAG: glycoside hydrolase family 97 protein [Elusimicrobia bacterium]|nr:glycoside hydrolase family 97 protein [Elusimicrobiota bacterium]